MCVRYHIKNFLYKKESLSTALFLILKCLFFPWYAKIIDSTLYVVLYICIEREREIVQYLIKWFAYTYIILLYCTLSLSLPLIYTYICMLSNKNR